MILDPILKTKSLIPPLGKGPISPHSADNGPVNNFVLTRLLLRIWRIKLLGYQPNLRLYNHSKERRKWNDRNISSNEQKVC